MIETLKVLMALYVWMVLVPVALGVLAVGVLWAGTKLHEWTTL